MSMVQNVQIKTSIDVNMLEGLNLVLLHLTIPCVPHFGYINPS